MVTLSFINLNKPSTREDADRRVIPLSGSK